MQTMKTMIAVKSIRVESFKATDKFGELIKGEHKRDNIFDSDKYYEFNINGFITTNMSYNTHVVMSGKKELKYDKYSNIIERIHYSGDNTVEMKFVTTYDNNGYFQEYVQYDSKGNIERKGINTLDNNGNVLKTYEYDLNGNLINENHYKYDLNNNRILDSVIEHNDSRTYKHIYSYDKKDRMIEHVLFYGMYNRKESQWFFKYDENDNCIEETSYSYDSFFSKKAFKFDKNNNKTEEVEYYSEEKIKYKKNWTYDDNENLIKEAWFSSENDKGGQYTYEYEFDTKQNWIKQIKYFNHVPKFIIERKIEYWE